MARLESMEVRQRDLAYAIHARHEDAIAKISQALEGPSDGSALRVDGVLAQLAALDEQHAAMAQRIASAEARYAELQQRAAATAPAEEAMRQQAEAATAATAAAAAEAHEAQEEARAVREVERDLRRALAEAQQDLARAGARYDALTMDRDRLASVAAEAERAWTAERSAVREQHFGELAAVKEEHVAMLEAAQKEFEAKLREELEGAEYRARHDVRTEMEESLSKTVDELSAKATQAEVRAEKAEKEHGQLLTKTRAYAKLIRDEFELYKANKEKELKKLFATGMAAGAESSEARDAAEASAMDVWEALRGSQNDRVGDTPIVGEAIEPDNSATFWYHPSSPEFLSGESAADGEDAPAAARAVLDLERDVKSLLGNLRSSQYTEALDTARREVDSERRALDAKKLQLAEESERTAQLKAKLKKVEAELRRFKNASKRDLEAAKSEAARLREAAKQVPDAASLKSQNSYLSAQLKVVRAELSRQRNRASALTDELKENRGDARQNSPGSAMASAELSNKLRRANLASVRKDAVIVSLRAKSDQLAREVEEARASGVGALEERIRVLSATIRRKDHALQSLRARFDTVAERAAKAALAESGAKTLRSSERIRGRFAEINAELQTYKLEMAAALASAEEASKNEQRAWETIEADASEMKRRAASLLSAVKALVTLILEAIATATGVARDMSAPDERNAFARLSGGPGAGEWVTARGLGIGGVAAVSDSVAGLLARVEAEVRVLDKGMRWSAEDLAEVVAVLDHEARASFQALIAAAEEAPVSIGEMPTPPASDLLARISADMAA